MIAIAALLVLVALGGFLYALSRRGGGETQPSEAQGDGWGSVAGEMLAGIKAAANRFPVTALLLLALALAANLAIAELLPDRMEEEELLYALFSAATLSLAGSLFGEARRWARARTQALAAILGLAGFALAWWADAFGTYPLAFLPAIAALVLVAPHLGRGTDAAFWMFGVRFAFALVLGGLALLLFAGGLSAIFASLTFLFGVEVPDDLYAHVWATTGLLAAPLFGLGQIPEDFDVPPDPHSLGFANRGMRALGDFVAAPLLLVYAAILHAYALKIVATGEVPEGQIGWLVLAYGFCLFGALIVIHPFLDGSRAPTRLLKRVWPLLLPVPLALLFYASWLRISAYGVTPDRYLLVLFGLAVLAVILLQLPRRTRGDIRLLAALPALALLAASFGPHGAVKTSLRSQTARFLDLVASRPLEGTAHDQALSALRFLADHEAIGRIAPSDLPPADAQGEPSLFRRVAAAYGIDPDIALSAEGVQQFSMSYGGGRALQAEGFDLVVPNVALHAGADDPVATALPSGTTLAIRLREGGVEIVSGTETVRFGIAEETVSAIAAAPGTEAPAIRLAAGARQILIVPALLYGDLGDKPVIRNLNGALFLRASDWR